MRERAAHCNIADERVTPLTLDVTNVSQIERAVDEVDTLDVLINNAGIAIYDDLSNLDVLEQHLAVNLFGTFHVTHALLAAAKALQRGHRQQPVPGGARSLYRSYPPTPFQRRPRST